MQCFIISSHVEWTWMLRGRVNVVGNLSCCGSHQHLCCCCCCMAQHGLISSFNARLKLTLTQLIISADAGSAAGKLMSRWKEDNLACCGN